MTLCVPAPEARPTRAVLAGALICGGLGLLAAPGCDDASRPLPRPDPVTFADEAYPALLRDCAFAGCHGDPRRPLFIPGPGRTRLNPAGELMAPPTADELQVAYDRSRALLTLVRVGDGRQSMPLLLQKTQGGAGHQGADLHGANIYEDPEAEGYQALRRWLYGEAGE